MMTQSNFQFPVLIFISVMTSSSALREWGLVLWATSSQFCTSKQLLEEYFTKSSQVCSLQRFLIFSNRLSCGQQRMQRNYPILQTRLKEASQFFFNGSSRSNFYPKYTLHCRPILVMLLSQMFYRMGSIFRSFFVLVEVIFMLGMWILNLNLPSSALFISSKILLARVLSKELVIYLQFFLAIASTKLSQMLLSLGQKFTPRNVCTFAIVRNLRLPELWLLMKGKLNSQLSFLALMKYDIGKYNNNWRELRVHREDKKSGGVGVVGVVGCQLERIKKIFKFILKQRRCRNREIQHNTIIYPLQ